jgi:hypothetical protein
MCWPLTRQWRPHSDDKGDREAVGTGRAGGREAEECPRKTTRSFAARGHDRRSPPVESQGDDRMRTGTGPETTSRLSLITSTACQSRLNGRGEKVQFSDVDRSVPACRGEGGSTSQLRDGLELDAVVVHQATKHMPRGALNAVKDRTALARLPGKPRHCG